VRFRRLQSWFGDRSQHPNLWETKPKPQHAMPKLPECVGVSRGVAIAASSLPATHTSSVPCIPQAQTPTLAPTFEKTLTPHPKICGNQKARATTTANLSCNARQRWTRLATVRAVGYPPTVYRPVSPV